MISDYIVIYTFLIIGGLSYVWDRRCYREWKGIRYKNLVISYAVPIEAVGLSAVLVYVLFVESIARTVWIITCVLSLSILAYEVWKVRR